MTIRSSQTGHDESHHQLAKHGSKFDVSSQPISVNTTALNIGKHLEHEFQFEENKIDGHDLQG